MSIIDSIINEQLLLEISLQQYFDKYVDHKKFSLEQFNILATIDPTSKNGQRGKYIDGILNLIKKDNELSVDWITSPSHQDWRDYVHDALQKFIDYSKNVSFNSFKTWSEFFDHVDNLDTEFKSKKEQKKQEKNIFNMPDDIRVIDVTDKWICIETLTREGNIKGAQYKTSPQANWCTAYVNDSYHWNQYHRKGDLLQFINKKDPYKKYQIFVEDGQIKETRDYDDQQDNTPFKIIKKLPNFEDNYGSIKEQEPLKFVFDERGTAHRFLDEYMDDEDEYLNRPRGDDEYEDYIPEEFNIAHWDRVIGEGADIFKYENERNTNHLDFFEQMEIFVDFFVDPHMGDDNDWHKKEAKEAVYDFYAGFQEMWDDRNEYEDEPQKEDYTDYHEFEIAHDKWYEEDKKSFLEEYKNQWEYIQFFLKKFPHEFDFGKTMLKDNSDEQMSFKFENIFNSILKNILNEEKTKIKLKCPKGYKVSVSKVKFSGGAELYDCKVWKNGVVIVGTSGTAFDYPETAKAYGIESAMICAGILPQRDDFSAWRNIELVESKFINEEEDVNVDNAPAQLEEPIEDSNNVSTEPEEDINDHIVERPDKKTARLLSFDRGAINKELLELTKAPSIEFPLEDILAILAKYKLTLANDSFKITKESGDDDLELDTTDGKTITNSVMVLYYSKIDGSDEFNFACYLS
jgi:hypothetical protein